MSDEKEPTGLERDYGPAPTDNRATMNTPGTPVAAATDSMAELEQRVGDARAAQAERANDERERNEGAFEAEAHPS